MERRLAAIVAADVVGYSRLMGEDEAGTLDALKAIRRELVAPEIARHKGRVVKLMGDGLLAEFGSVVDAVECAVAIQVGMVKRNELLPGLRQIQLRIGINLGDVIVEGRDIYGDGVNVAARLEALASPGGICISDRVHEQVEGKLDCHFIDAGEQTVKNIARPIRVWQWPEEVTGAAASLPLPDKPSIAVLPLTNMSGDPEQEYFSDGITEDIITELSRCRWFLVIARNSTFAYKGKAVDLKRVARELGVQYVLEGSIRRAGDRVRITAQLIDASSGTHIWAERFDRSLTDIFAVQDEVTQSVVAAITPEYLAFETRRVQRRDVKGMAAWDMALRARWHSTRSTKDDNAESKKLCLNAIAIDPQNALAYAILARSELYSAFYDWTPSRQETMEAARQAARKAVSLDDRNASSWAILSFVDLFTKRHDRALESGRRAVELNPNDAYGHAVLGITLVYLHELEEASKCLATALRLSPRDIELPVWYNHLSIMHYLAGDYESAVMASRKGVDANPEHPSCYRVMAANYGTLGRAAEAKSAVARLLELSPTMTISRTAELMPFKYAEDRERYLEGLRKAGLPE